MDFFGDFNFAHALAGASGVAAVGFQLHPLDGKRPYSERVSEGGGDYLEVIDAFGVGLFVDAVERRDAFIFQIVGDAFVGGEHEFFDQAVGDVALGSGDAFHHAEFVKLDYGLRGDRSRLIPGVCVCGSGSSPDRACVRNGRFERRIRGGRRRASASPSITAFTAV